jgi:drug/metabolite transporter (DMT)-like permease
MTGLALLLVLIAAFAHAAWNYLSKIANGGTAFIWLFSCMSVVCYLPPALWILMVQQPVLGWQQFAFMAISSALHILYYQLLTKGYTCGDLSLVYPLARGTGPMLSIIAAIIFLGEQPSGIALAGAGLIGTGIVIMTGNPLKPKDSAAFRPIIFALFCGVAIAAYTISDKLAVSTYLIPPLLLDWASNLGRVCLLTPYALKNWDKVKQQWQNHKMKSLGVGVLCPLAYILVLSAMTFSPVSYIAPAREISILIGTLIGAKFLAEKDMKWRLAGATAMVLGLATLSVG